MDAPANEVKLYFEFKSPYAYFAKDLAFELPSRFDVDHRFLR